VVMRVVTTSTIQVPACPCGIYFKSTARPTIDPRPDNPSNRLGYMVTAFPRISRVVAGTGEITLLSCSVLHQLFWG
jgi:hypothetical protein